MPVTASRPIIEQIAATVFDRLRLLEAGLQPSSIVTEVVRPRRFAQYTPKHLQVVLVQSESERQPEMDCPGSPPGIAKTQVFSIHCHVMPSEKDTTSFDEYANVIWADVIRALTQPGAQWQTFGNLAIDSEIGEPEAIAADGGVDGFRLPLLVTYRTSEHDPYTKR